MDRGRIRHVGSVVWVLMLLASFARAQPDPQQMSGIPLPVSDLPVGAMSVRVVRGQLSNNIPDQPVELHQGDDRGDRLDRRKWPRTIQWPQPGNIGLRGDDRGWPAPRVAAVSMPGQGGVRLVLAAVVPGAGPAVEVDARPGTVTFGAESRFQVELGEESVEVYYLFNVMNFADVPVMPSRPLVFEMPPGAQTTTVLPESTPRATANGREVTVTGPFQPGRTVVSTAYNLPYSGGRLEISQRLPAELEELFIMAETTGDMELVSPQIVRHVEMAPAGGLAYLLGAGPSIPAGGTLRFVLTGLPHHSTMPRTIALVLAALVIGSGVWASASAGHTASGQRRQALQARRDRLFKDLVRIEQQHRSQKIGATRYTNRRQELVTLLELVYGKLEQEELAPGVDSAQGPVPMRVARRRPGQDRRVSHRLAEPRDPRAERHDRPIRLRSPHRLRRLPLLRSPARVVPRVAGMQGG